MLSSDIIVPRQRAVAMMEKCVESARRHHLTITHAGYHGTGLFHPVILLSEDLQERERARKALSELARYALSAGGNMAGPFSRVGPEMAHGHQTAGETASQLVAGIKGAMDPKGVMKPLPFDLVEGLPPFTGI